MDPERAEVAVIDPQRLNEFVGVGQGVDVGPAEPVDPAGDYRVGSLGGDAVQVAAEDGPRVSRIDGLVDVGDVEGIDRAGGLRLEIGYVLLLDGHVVAGAQPGEVAPDECAERVAERLRRGFEPPWDVLRLGEG